MENANELKIKKIGIDLSNWRIWGTETSIKTNLCMKYKLENKGIAEVVEQLKQRAMVIAEKTKWYDNQIIQFHWNLQCIANQHQFCKILENRKGLISNNKKSAKKWTLKFWKRLSKILPKQCIWLWSHNTWCIKFKRGVHKFRNVIQKCIWPQKIRN